MLKNLFKSSTKNKIIKRKSYHVYMITYGFKMSEALKGCGDNSWENNCWRGLIHCNNVRCAFVSGGHSLISPRLYCHRFCFSKNKLNFVLDKGRQHGTKFRNGYTQACIFFPKKISLVRNTTVRPVRYNK